MERLLKSGSRPRIRKIWAQFRDWQASGDMVSPDTPPAVTLILETTTPAERALTGWKFPYPTADELRARTLEERERIGHDAQVLFSRYLQPPMSEVPDSKLDMGSYVGRHQGWLLGPGSPLNPREQIVMAGLYGAGGRDRVSTPQERATEIGRSIRTMKRIEHTLLQKLTVLQQE